MLVGARAITSGIKEGKSQRTRALLHVLRAGLALGQGVGALVGAHDEVRQPLVRDGVHDVLFRVCVRVAEGRKCKSSLVHQPSTMHACLLSNGRVCVPGGRRGHPGAGGGVRQLHVSAASARRRTGLEWEGGRGGAGSLSKSSRSPGNFQSIESSQATYVRTADGVGSGDDGAACLEGGDYASLGHGDGLLLQRLVCVWERTWAQE